MDSLKVLYEDNHIIAVYKPAGMLVQGNGSGSLTLFKWTKQYLKEKYKKPGNVFLGLVHRLDRPVSGIVLFGKTSKGASRLSMQFRAGTIQKTYHAVVEGVPESSHGILQNTLKKDVGKRIAVTSTSGKPSKLTYKTVRSGKHFTLLKIIPRTGRFHQIRIQLSAMGNPIVGDIKYNASKPLPNNTIALCATSIEFMSATGNKKHILNIPIPDSWNELLE